jgi:hypothetical protein
VKAIAIFALSLLLTGAAPAQHQHETPPAQPQHQHLAAETPQKPAPDAAAHQQHEGHGAEPMTMIDQIMHHATAGTTVEPLSTAFPMLMTQKGEWRLMVHGNLFVNAVQQSGPRGYDKVFASNWIMPMAQRELGPGTFTVRAMFSLEPATVTERYYPSLFQLGETAFGRPIVDGQHPHDFIMEIAALYDIRIGENSLLSLYGGPVGDPAMGPSAFPHRASASENPIAALGHHLQDSTHIANNVLTAGFTHRNVRLEVSGFHGREPDEERWDFDSGPIDSWSTRLSANLGQDWSGQFSIGRLNSPEVLHPDEDTLRMTASVAHNRKFSRGRWSSLLLWGRNRNMGHHGAQIFNSYLAESTVRLDRNYFWGRIENVDRSSELLLGKNPPPPGFEEEFLARIQAYTVGYAREIPMIPHVSTAIGGQVTFYGQPDFLEPIYGSNPRGAAVFLRFRLGKE